MELDCQNAYEDDAEGTEQGTDFNAESPLHAKQIGQTSCHAGYGIDFATEDERHFVHQHVADDTASGSRNGTHRDGYPERIPQSQRLLDADDIEERKSDGIEDEPGVVVVDDVLAEHTDCQHRQSTADEVTAVGHPERIEPEHEVTNRSATDSCCHTHNPSTEDVELLGTGQTHARDGKGKGAYELDDDERDGQPQRIAHVL